LRVKLGCKCARAKLRSAQDFVYPIDAVLSATVHHPAKMDQRIEPNWRLFRGPTTAAGAWDQSTRFAVRASTELFSEKGIFEPHGGV